MISQYMSTKLITSPKRPEAPSLGFFQMAKSGQEWIANFPTGAAETASSQLKRG